jgi:hypothetical protein
MVQQTRSAMHIAPEIDRQSFDTGQLLDNRKSLFGAEHANRGWQSIGNGGSGFRHPSLCFPEG